MITDDYYSQPVMKKIWVNGCFDILHIGHIRLINYARGLGDYLTVGIDSDDRVMKLKGPDRPFNNEDLRREFLLSLSSVDSVVIFKDESELIQNIKNHDLIVVGREYEERGVIGSDFCQVVFFDRIGDYSTTNLLSNKRQ